MAPTKAYSGIVRIKRIINANQKYERIGCNCGTDGHQFGPGQAAIHNPGLVSFQNTETARPPGAPATIHLISFPCELTVGTQYKAELYYLDTAIGSMAPLPASLSSFKASTTSNPGTWDGPAGLIPLPDGYGGVDVFEDGSGESGDGTGSGPGYYPVLLQVRVWDSTTGNDWESATLTGSTANFIYTQRFTYRATDTQMINQRGFTILYCPEPSAVALVVLGVISLLVFRGRK